jgi:hypothetical protein
VAGDNQGVRTEPAQAQREHERLALRVTSALSARLSPEGTRRPTLFERLTVRRLDWQWIVRLNAWLSALGKVATCIWVGVIASIVVGIDVRPVVEEALNSGQTIEHAFALAILIPTIVFLLARSMIGWLRWKLQRELWRRDVERLSE